MMGTMSPVVQNHQPFWNDGTEIPAHVTEFLAGNPGFPNYELHLMIGYEENTRGVPAHYRSTFELAFKNLS